MSFLTAFSACSDVGRGVNTWEDKAAIQRGLCYFLPLFAFLNLGVFTQKHEDCKETLQRRAIQNENKKNSFGLLTYP